MVARHNRRLRRHTAGDGVCIDCGTRYLPTSAYKGNYCPACHEAWIARQRAESPSSHAPPRVRPSDRRPTDRDGTVDESYDE